MKKRFVLVLIVVIIALLAFFAYFFVISPSFVSKPVIEKAALVSGEDVSAAHVNFVLNEVGAYKLHSSNYFFGEPAVIESVITDKQAVFTTTIINNVPQTVAGPASKPDVRFSMSYAGFEKLYSTSDILSNAKIMNKNGEISVEIINSESALAAKGFKAIYDSLE